MEAGMLEVKAITAYDEFLGLKPFWNGLLAESGNDTPFLTFEWFDHWWKMFGHTARMLVLVVKDSGNMVAIAPLIQKRIFLRGLPMRAIAFMANYYSPRTGM